MYVPALDFQLNENEFHHFGYVSTYKPGYLFLPLPHPIFQTVSLSLSLSLHIVNLLRVMTAKTKNNIFKISSPLFNFVSS
jgi:hypothetical protein